MPSFSPLVEVDARKCVNCHVCIAVCPVKFCNDGSGDHVSLDPDLCLGCGACIPACSHQARRGIDDGPAWQAMLEAKRPFVAFLAPSAASNFPGLTGNLTGWLHSAGAVAVVDVSFGAELATWGYGQTVARDGADTVVCQPCPVLVNYAELYRPELIPMLSPVGSPVAHAIAHFKRLRPDLASLPMVFFSPCLAKKREFEEIGEPVLNITFATLSAILEQRGVRLESVREEAFDTPAVERGGLYPSPGGLTRAVERWRPDLAEKARRIEGAHVFPYLDGLADKSRRGLSPRLVDCLNCENGCNGGPGSVKIHEHPDALETPVAGRVAELQRRNRQTWPWGALSRRLADMWADFKMRRLLGKEWTPDLAPRGYADLSRKSALRRPSREELIKLYTSMGKFSPGDLLNCRACGYESCEQMATAVHNGLNKFQNCHYFQRWDSERKLLEQARHEAHEREMVHEEALREVEERLRGETVKILETISDQVQRMRQSYGGNIATFQELERVVGEAVEALQHFSVISRTIQSVSFQTGLLSINASIEAARAGRLGKGFAVVADEVKRLSNMSGSEAEKIVPQMERMGGIFERLAESSRSLAGRVSQHRLSLDTIDAELSHMAELWEREKRGLSLPGPAAGEGRYGVVEHK